MTVNNGGPAFPSVHPHFPGAIGITRDSGMTLRQWYAGLAMQGMATIALEDGDMLLGWADMARAAVIAADALIAELAKDTTNDRN